MKLSDREILLKIPLNEHIFVKNSEGGIFKFLPKPLFNHISTIKIISFPNLILEINHFTKLQPSSYFSKLRGLLPEYKKVLFEKRLFHLKFGARHSKRDQNMSNKI